MRGAIPPLPQYVFMSWCLVKYRDNFTFTLYKLTNFVKDSPCRSAGQDTTPPPHPHGNRRLVTVFKRALSEMKPLRTFLHYFSEISSTESIYKYTLKIMRHIIGDKKLYEGVSKNVRNGRLERELHMVQLSATECSCITIFWVSLVSFAVITLGVPSQRVFIVAVVYFVMTQSGNFWIHPCMHTISTEHG
jgi:hypothetical protein